MDNKSLYVFTDVIATKLLGYFNKVMNYNETSRGKKVIRGLCRLVVLLLVLAIFKIIFDVVGYLGTNLIYSVGTILRGAISKVWRMLVRYTFFVFAFASLYDLALDMSKSRSYNIKVGKAKKISLYKEISDVLKIVITLLGVPIMILLFVECGILGLFFSLWVKGASCFGLIFMLIGIIIMTFAYLLMIFDKVLEKGGWVK